MAEGGGLNIAVLGSAAIGILVFAVVIMLGPTIGGSMESAMPDLSATSQWNASYRGKSLKRGFFGTIQHRYSHWVAGLGADNPLPDRLCNRHYCRDHHLRDSWSGIT